MAIYMAISPHAPPRIQAWGREEEEKKERKEDSKSNTHVPNWGVKYNGMQLHDGGNSCVMCTVECFRIISNLLGCIQSQTQICNRKENSAYIAANIQSHDIPSALTLRSLANTFPLTSGLRASRYDRDQQICSKTNL